MRPQRILTTFIFLSLLILAVPALAQTVVVEPMAVDFGVMNQNEVRKADITVSNAGNEILIITEIDADCGCTVADIEKTELAPGQRTTLHVTFESKRFYGPTYKYLHLRTNDPNNGVVDIALTVNIHAPLIAVPGKNIKFDNTRLGDVQTKTVTLKAADVPELKISANVTEKGLYDFEIIHGVDGDPQSAQVKLILPADLQVTGLVQDVLRVTTNVPEEPYIDLGMKAVVGRTLVSYPEKVNFRFKKQFSRDVRIHPFIRGELPFEVTKLDIDIPGVKAEITGGKPNFEVVIKLSGRPIPKSDPRAVEAGGKIKGTLTVHTDREDVPTIEVPISYQIRM